MDAMGLSSKRLITFFVVLSSNLSLALLITLLYQNCSSFVLFQGFTKGKVPGGIAQNVKTELLSGGLNVTTNGVGLGERVQNISYDNLGGRDKKNTVSKVSQGKTQNGITIDGRAKNITASDAGSKYASFISSTNDSTPIAGNHDGKLLDGLLVSGFDETSCISRLQSHLYRKASPHKPSPYLISKLRNYEEFHRKCGPNSRAYNTNMVKLQSSKKHGADGICKYLIWTPLYGLGNQIISMASAFLYAVLTDRVLLVKFGKDIRGLFCEPFLNSTWILPKKSPFWSQRHIETYLDILDKDSTNNSKKDLPSSLILNIDPKGFFHCDHSQDLFRKVPLLVLQTDEYFVPSLFVVPSFNQEITRMFPEKDTVFHHLARYLFHPSNEAWGLISRFYDTYLARADERIGLQVRSFHPAVTPHQAVMDLLLSCIMKHKLLPEVEIQKSVASTVKNQTLKAVLVASLHPEYGENLRTMYLKKPTVTGELIGVYQPSHEELQKFRDDSQNMKAWTEMYLLSLSDVLMTTSKSTFGYVAQGLGGLKPWYLYRLVENESHVHDPPCERDLSLEPCYHLPPAYYCNGKPINVQDFDSAFPYVRKCEDFRYGTKLVNDF